MRTHPATKACRLNRTHGGVNAFPPTGSFFGQTDLAPKTLVAPTLMLDFFAARSGSLKSDVLSGMTVALALVPEAIAFAFVAGVSPIIGLYSAFFLGILTAIFGGRPGMISGATGAMAVVVVSLVAIHGVEYLFPTVMLCGIFQIAIGLAKLGKFIRIVPYPVMLGFVNGLAIVIGLAQLGSFKTLSASGTLEYLSGPRLAWMLGLVVLAMLIIHFLPKLTRAVPSSLAAIVVVTLLALGVNHFIASPAENGNTIATVGDMLRDNAAAEAIAEGQDPSAVAAVGISGSLPTPFFIDHVLPPLTFESLRTILPYAIILCGVGLIESLMTLTLIDEITETRGKGNRECVGQGIANVVCGFFGGMGGCAMIGQSLINVNSGGRGRASGIVAALCLLAFILFLGPWIEMISMAALVGVMFMVVIGTFEWASLRMFKRMPASDVAVMVLVTAYTVVMHDLASAVILGVIVSALVFAWKHATHIFADVKHNEHGSKIYQLHGPLFFASVTHFKDLFDVQNDPDDVVVDFYYTRVYDQSGLEAINTLAEKYEAAGKRLHLTHLSGECRSLLDRAGDFVEINLSEDPQYHVATDRI